MIEELRRRHAPVIVDTAGFRNRTTIGALVATDLAIIPLKSAVEDVDAAIATYDLIREINETDEREGRPIKIAMVLTMTLRGTVIARHVREQLTVAGYPLLQAGMLNRVARCGSASTHQGGFMPNREPVCCQAATEAGFPDASLGGGEGDHTEHRITSLNC
jgi:cellulose biosynthesis protein BcsQ